MTGEDICPSCGLSKDIDKGLCKYCYFRGLANSSKLVYLTIMKGVDDEPKKFSAEELVIEFNKLPFIKTETKLSTVKKYLVNYKNLGYVTATSIRDGNRGRPKKLYKISEHGKKILKRYIDNWRRGSMLLLKKKHKKFKMSDDFKNRASAIRGKMFNEPGYKENSLNFILTQRMPSKSPLHPVSKVS